MDQNRFFIYALLYLLTHYAQTRHSLALICGDGVGMGPYVVGMGWGWGRGGDGYRGCVDGVGDGYSVHGDGRGWGSFSVPCRPLEDNTAAGGTIVTVNVHGSNSILH